MKPTESDDAVRSLPAIPQPGPNLTRGEKIFRGMVGMGTVFGVVGGGIIATMGAVAFISGVDRDDLDFMLVAPFAAFGIAFGLGMLYAGLLALLARGRSFRDVSIARVAAAGAAIGLIPGLVVIVGAALEGGSPAEARDAFTIFPVSGAIGAIVTLLIARRAKPERVPGGEADN